jgi:hypothetical protein
MTTDSETDESCLTCGAMYQLLPTPDGIAEGDYFTNAGETPQECTGNTQMVHGYPGERYCHGCNATDCEHTKHDCPCILCDS